MQTCLRLSEATALALHTVGVLARNRDRLLSNQEIASRLSVSGNHLAKVHAKLARAGIIKGVRGPSGGFQLGKPAADIPLLAVVEAVEGPFIPAQCLLGRPRCERVDCVLGCLTTKVNEQVKEFLSGTTVAALE